jgi:hypothetical protein
LLLLRQQTIPGQEGDIMNSMRCHLQHLLNPLHLYCRLQQAGFAEPLARRLCKVYERSVYRRILA